MIGEGVFILAVSLSGNYTDMKYISNFPNCTIAMQHFKEHCSEYKAASCTTKKYTMLPSNHLDISPFDFAITEPQSCKLVWVDKRKFINDK